MLNQNIITNLNYVTHEYLAHVFLTSVEILKQK